MAFGTQSRAGEAGSQVHIELFKQTKTSSLGLALSGSNAKGPIVHSVVASGTAAAVMIKPGMRLVSVNDRAVFGHTEGTAALREAIGVGKLELLL